MKFSSGKSIKELVGQPSLWSQPDTFNAKGSFSADKASAYLAKLIATAEAAVAKDKNSLYVNLLPGGRGSQFQRHPRGQLQHGPGRIADGDQGRARRHEEPGGRRLPRPPRRHRHQRYQSARARPPAHPELDVRAGRLRDAGGQGGRGERRVARLRLRRARPARAVPQFGAAQLRLQDQPHAQQAVRGRRHARRRRPGGGGGGRRQRGGHHRLLPGSQRRRRAGRRRLFVRRAGNV